LQINLSSIIIAKNEAGNIRNCIESLSGVIDEIVVVVDSSSSDDTYRIAAGYPKVKVYSSEWLGYSGTKEFALSKTTNDWVFWIDADETLTDDLKNELAGFKKSTPAYDSYRVARRAYFLGKWIKYSGWYPGRVTRLFNKKKAGFSDSQVHESLVIKGTTGNLKNDLNHFTDPDISHYYSKFNNYTSLAAGEIFAKGKKNRLSDLLIRPVFIFIKMYFLRFGFLDGRHGFILAVFSANYVFTKYCKLWEIFERKGNK